MVIAIAVACQDVEQHGIRNAELRGKLFRFSLCKAREGLLGPGHFAFAGGFLLQLLQALGVVADAAAFLGIFDFVLGGLDHHSALGVIAGSAGAAGNLVEFARFEDALALAVELGKASHQHGADGHVNAHTQGIGAANDLKQALLCQALYQSAVFGKHARVVDADALAQQLG